MVVVADVLMVLFVVVALLLAVVVLVTLMCVSLDMLGVIDLKEIRERCRFRRQLDSFSRRGGV